MKRQLNYDLLLFHVREASQELDTLLLRIKKMLGELEEPLSEADKAILAVYDRPFEEAGLKVSLGHAYHHLNFAWNVRYKETKDADKHFDRGEKFPKAFTRFWSKSMIRKRKLQRGMIKCKKECYDK
jgi:hypothetical protein